MPKVIGIDVGGTKIAGAVVSGSRVVEYAVVPTPKARSMFLERLFGLIDNLISMDIKSIGIGFPAPVVRGAVFEVQNIPNLNKTSIKKIVEQK